MNRFYLIIIMVFVGVSAFCSQHANVVWNTPSRNSSESMPCGGGDIGMNIWVEEYRNFGGIRNEEDYLITETGARRLGKKIPLTPEEVEALR